MSLMWLRASALKAGVNILEPALVGLLSHNGGLSKTPEKDGQVSLCLFQGWAVARGGPAEDQRCPGFCTFSLFLRLGASISFGQVVSRVFTPKSGKQLAAFSFPFKSSSKSLWVATMGAFASTMWRLVRLSALGTHACAKLGKAWPIAALDGVLF